MPKFQLRDLVVLNTNEPYHRRMNGERIYKNEYWVEDRGINTAFVVMKEADEVGDVRLIPEGAENDWEAMYINENCLDLKNKPAVTNDGPKTVDILISEHAHKLDEAIANGTMVPHLSSIGFLAEFLIEYKRLEG